MVTDKEKLIDELTNAVDEGIRKSSHSSYSDWEEVILGTLARKEGHWR